MSAPLGTSLEKDFLQVGSIKFPLPKSPANGGEEYEILRTTPLEPFQASTVLGDDSLISDDRIAAASFSDFRPGIGVRRYQEIESIGGIQDGDLMTFEGFLTVPFYRETVATSLLTGGLYTKGYELDPTGQYRFIIYEPETGRPYVWNNTGGAFETLTNPPTALGPNWCAFARLGRYYIYAYGLSIWYSLDGKTWTQGWTPGGNIILHGLVEHDNKVYVFVHDNVLNTLVLRWVATEGQLTAGVGVAWPGVSVTMNWSGGRFYSIVDWKDKNTDDPQIYFNDGRKIYVYNDADFFSEFWVIPNAHQSYKPNMVVNPRDRLLYFCNGRNKSVLVFNHQTVEELGPDKNFGLNQGSTTNGDFAVQLLYANTRHMFAFGRATDPTGQGRILVANDAFGWSPLARARRASNEDLEAAPSANEKITGMFYAGGAGNIYLVRTNGAVESIYFPDEPFTSYRYIATAVPPGRHREPGTWWAYSGEFDAGRELDYKLLKYFRIHLERQETGAFGLMNKAGTEVRFKYQIDGGGWSAHTVLGPLNTWPKVIPIPSLAVQSGTQFRKLRWAVGINAANLANNYETPILRSVVVAYTREPDIYDGIQVPVDLSDERWDNGKLKKFCGLSRQALRDAIEDLKSGPGQAKQHYQVVIGWRGNTKTYASMDVRVSGVEDPNSRYGRFTLTLRQLDAPPDG